MNNDSTDLLKLVGLDTYDIDKEKTSITTTASETIINLYLKRRVM